MGVEGTAIATSISYTLTFILFQVFERRMEEIRAVVRVDTREYWRIIRNWRGLLDYLKVGISSIALLCLEWWALEVIVLFSAKISVEATAC